MMFLKFLSAAAAAVFTVSTAHAAIFTQAAKVTGSGQPDYTMADLDFTGFDTTLGTLNGITIQGQISVSETLRYSYVVTSSMSSSVPVTLSFSLGVSPAPGYVYTSLDTTGSATYPSGGEVIQVSGASSLTEVLSAATVAKLLGGSGFSGTIGSSVTSPRGPSSLNGTVSASASALYDYTPIGTATNVPEPGTLALIGLAGVVPLIRRKRKQG